MRDTAPVERFFFPFFRLFQLELCQRHERRVVRCAGFAVAF